MPYHNLAALVAKATKSVLTLDDVIALVKTEESKIDFPLEEFNIWLLAIYDKKKVRYYYLDQKTYEFKFSHESRRY